MLKKPSAAWVDECWKLWRLCSFCWGAETGGILQQILPWCLSCWKDLPCADGRSKMVKSFPMVWNNCKLTLSCFSLPRTTVVMSKREAQNDAVAKGGFVLAVLLEKIHKRKQETLQHALHALECTVLVHPHSLWVWHWRSRAHDFPQSHVPGI